MIKFVKLVAVVSILALVIKLVEKGSSLLLGLLLLVLAGILIYCLVTASWQNLLIFVELGITALFAIESIMVLVKALHNWIGRFLHS